MKARGAGGLTFQTPEARPVSLALLGFIALSALIHAISFYVFQLTYPPAAHVEPPPAEVSVITPGSRESAMLLRWIEAEDPARVSRPPEALPAGLLDFPYTPSFAEVRAAPKTADKQPSTLVFPAVTSGPDAVRRSLPRREINAPQLPAPPTQTRFSGSLAGRAISHEASKNFGARDIAELRPARFLIGVSDRGEVRYIFPQAGSGDKALDAEAEAWLRQLEFAPAQEPIAWGFATFAWGGDAFPSPSPLAPRSSSP
jgi:hypothetical protein